MVTQTQRSFPNTAWQNKVAGTCRTGPACLQPLLCLVNREHPPFLKFSYLFRKAKLVGSVAQGSGGANSACPDLEAPWLLEMASTHLEALPSRENQHRLFLTVSESSDITVGFKRHGIIFLFSLPYCPLNTRSFGGNLQKSPLKFRTFSCQSKLYSFIKPHLDKLS